MKYLVWGCGRNWNQIRYCVDYGNISCFSDNNSKVWDTYINNVPVYSPEKAVTQEFDYAVITTDQYFDEIKKQLVDNYQVDPDKIITRIVYVSMENKNTEQANQASFIEALKVISSLHGKALDLDKCFVRYSVFTKEIDENSSLNGLNIDYVNNSSDKIPEIYQNVYSGNIDILNIADEYDVVIGGTNYWRLSSNDLYEKVECDLKYGKRLLIIRPDIEEDVVEKLSEKYNVRYEQYLHSGIYLLEKKKKNDISIFVVCHKNCVIPRDDMYVPIHVGKNDFELPGMVRDDTAENIAEFNSTINECTAMYWMWKNAKCEYIGLNHYRRFFVSNNYVSRINILNEETISEYLSEYDIILAPKYFTKYQTIKEHLSGDVSDPSGIDIARGIIAEYQPDYLEAFDKVFNGFSLYRCNLFITRKELFDSYCEWLFSFILKVNESIDVTNLDGYSSRMAGFIAERMLTVWLLEKKFKIKELPFVLTD